MAKRQTKGIDVYRHTMALLEKHRLDARKGHAMLSSLAKKDLTELLSGGYTKKQTRGAFARNPVRPPQKAGTGRRRELTARQMKLRDLKGTIPVNPVNVQSGRLRRETRLKKGSRGVQDYRLVVSGVPYAKFVLAVGGTAKMVSREVQPVLVKRWRPRNKALLDHVRASRSAP